jgi:DNA-binding MarR family transcriptional regulator
VSAPKVRSRDKVPTNRGKQSLRLWLRLLACENLVENRVRAQLREQFNVTLPQFDVLSELEHAGEALTMSQLSGKLMVSNGNVTGVVDRLERAGYVRREASKTDRRVQFIALTTHGERLFRDMAAAHEEWVTDLFVGLTASEIKSLLGGLDKAKTSISSNLSLDSQSLS